MPSSRRLFNQLMKAGWSLVFVGDIVGRIEGYKNSIELLEEKGVKKTDPIIVELHMRVLDNLSDFLETVQNILEKEKQFTLSRDFKTIVLKVTELVDKARMAKSEDRLEEASKFIDCAVKEVERFSKETKKSIQVLLDAKRAEIRRLLKPPKSKFSR